MTKLLVFLLVSVGIVYLSRRSLLHPLSHGFYRFFAFEFLALLILFNVERWFHDPFSPQQIASWILLFASIPLAIQSFVLLRRVGRPGRGCVSSTNFGFENTTSLVAVGLYRYIRHPMSASLLFVGWGAYLKDPSLRAAVAVVIASISLAATAKVEELENIATFGDSYREYRKRTKMFVPFVL